MDGLFANYSKLSIRTSVDPTDFGITSVLQTVYRVAQYAQENIDLKVLSVNNKHQSPVPQQTVVIGRIFEGFALRVVERLTFCGRYTGYD